MLLKQGERWAFARLSVREQIRAVSFLPSEIPLVPANSSIAKHPEPPPDATISYAYFGVISVAFLAAAAALSTIGLWLFGDSVLKLARRERPPIGLMMV